MKNLFLRKSTVEKKIQKSLHVYISEKYSEIIFVPMCREIKTPIYFEQETYEIIDFKSPIEIIGESIKRNFNKFSLKDRTSIHHKKSDWQALEASKERTIVSFEKNYKRFSIGGANEYNLILIIESYLNNSSNIELKTTISANSENSELGKRLLQLYNSDICERKQN